MNVTSFLKNRLKGIKNLQRLSSSIIKILKENCEKLLGPDNKKHKNVVKYEIVCQSGKSYMQLHLQHLKIVVHQEEKSDRRVLKEKRNFNFLKDKVLVRLSRL